MWRVAIDARVVRASHRLLNFRHCVWCPVQLHATVVQKAFPQGHEFESSALRGEILTIRRAYYLIDHGCFSGCQGRGEANLCRIFDVSPPRFVRDLGAPRRDSAAFLAFSSSGLLVTHFSVSQQVDGWHYHLVFVLSIQMGKSMCVPSSSPGVRV